MPVVVPIEMSANAERQHDTFAASTNSVQSGAMDGGPGYTLALYMKVDMKWKYGFIETQ